MKAQSNRVHSPERCADIDLALAVMCCLTAPGKCWSHEAIAEITGMSHFGPQAIEQRALMKLRRGAASKLKRELVA